MQEAPDVKLWFTSSSTLMRLLLIVYHPYMEMNVSLSVSLAACATVTINPCEAIDLHTSHHSSLEYSLEKISEETLEDSMTYDKHDHAKKYFSFYKQFSCDNPVVSFTDRSNDSFYTYALLLSEKKCLSLQLLAHMPIISGVHIDPSPPSQSYTFFRDRCTYHLIAASTYHNAAGYHMRNAWMELNRFVLFSSGGLFINSDTLEKALHSVSVSGTKFQTLLTISSHSSIFTQSALKLVGWNKRKYFEKQTKFVFSFNQIVTHQADFQTLLQLISVQFQSKVVDNSSDCRIVSLAIQRKAAVQCLPVFARLSFPFSRTKWDDRGYDPYSWDPCASNRLVDCPHRSAISFVTETHVSQREDFFLDHRIHSGSQRYSLNAILTVHLQTDRHLETHLENTSQELCSLVIKQDDSVKCFDKSLKLCKEMHSEQLNFRNFSYTLYDNKDFTEHIAAKHKSHDYQSTSCTAFGLLSIVSCTDNFMKATWQTAYQFCLFKNNSLLSIGSEEEEKRVVSLMLRKNVKQAYSIPAVYLGLRWKGVSTIRATNQLLSCWNVFLE